MKQTKTDLEIHRTNERLPHGKKIGACGCLSSGGWARKTE